MTSFCWEAQRRQDGVFMAGDELRAHGGGLSGADFPGGFRLCEDGEVLIFTLEGGNVKPLRGIHFQEVPRRWRFKKS